ncbi:PREDICTED: protein sidekick-2-like [Amphimedon queenslandica]|uniref:Uncharacterized protein n=1 Tax=Amphimedon queenslandica TaxID=400682 RepID=A0AAN0JMM6_AMPQE|nr:PREDICTED: protein sidekick-2-like [Amphimedon queenslandica]|eukprot:XP_019858253.1 PREDICTED: protein sidekick-2-like [Amphimedon queenslandica]
MKCLVCFILVFSLSVAQDCPLPANADIWNALATLLLDADGSQSYSPKITGSVQYVCQAQGNMINTYTEISLIATYTPNPGEAETTRILSMGCSSGTWSGITQDGLSPPPASVIGVSLRTNCFQCREGFSRETRCRECDSACNSGLMRCTGSGSGDCCLSFAANGQCSNDLSCLSSGPNYVATESTNFTCTCNLTCSVGYSVNSNCTDCYLASICDADSPCMNGGQCIQYSPPDNYTCNCTGTGFQGVNCTVSDLVTDGSCPANISFLFVIRDLTINVPLTEPVCIRCRFFSNQGVFISFSDGIWRKGSTVLSDGDFSGNVIISSTSTTLFLTLVHPATVVDVGDTLTCSSSSADQNSIVTIGAFMVHHAYVWINDSDGSELTPVINNPPLTLHLTNINRAASGNYTCRSTNTDLPGVNMDTTVTLNVQYLDIISVSLNQTVAIGTNYTITCSFDAFPMIESVTWFHNRTAINLKAFPHININTESTTSELSLLPIGGLDDGGEYSCSVSNGVLNASDSLLNLTVVFLLKPDPVYNLMTSNITNTSVTLSWSLGFNGNSPITGGIVSYAAVSNGFGNGTEVFMGENEELIIFNLQPFTVYNFSVAVENAIGISNDVTIVAETQPNVPDAPTLNSVVVISSNSLKVNWTNNVDPLTQSEVEWYTVMYFTERQHNELNVPAPANTVIINGLLEGTSYSIVVSATNSAGIGASGNSITIQTGKLLGTTVIV